MKVPTLPHTSILEWPTTSEIFEVNFAFLYIIGFEQTMPTICFQQKDHIREDLYEPNISTIDGFLFLPF